MRLAKSSRAAGARGPPRRQNSPHARPQHLTRIKQCKPMGFYWHPCRRSASPLSAEVAHPACHAMQPAVLTGRMHSETDPHEHGGAPARVNAPRFRPFRYAGPTPQDTSRKAHADRPLSTRHSAKYRHKSCGFAPCLQVEAHIIEPAGFPVTDRAFRRAGMDYLNAVAILRHASWEQFAGWRQTDGGRLLLFTTRGSRSYLDAHYRPDDILLFGRENKDRCAGCRANGGG